MLPLILTWLRSAVFETSPQHAGGLSAALDGATASTRAVGLLAPAEGQD